MRCAKCKVPTIKGGPQWQYTMHITHDTVQHCLQRKQGANYTVLRHAAACFNRWCLVATMWEDAPRAGKRTNETHHPEELRDALEEARVLPTDIEQVRTDARGVWLAFHCITEIHEGHQNCLYERALQQNKGQAGPRGDEQAGGVGAKGRPMSAREHAQYTRSAKNKSSEITKCKAQDKPIRAYFLPCSHPMIQDRAPILQSAKITRNAQDQKMQRFCQMARCPCLVPQKCAPPRMRGDGRRKGALVYLFFFVCAACPVPLFVRLPCRICTSSHSLW